MKPEFNQEISIEAEARLSKLSGSLRVGIVIFVGLFFYLFVYPIAIGLIIEKTAIFDTDNWFGDAIYVTFIPILFLYENVSIYENLVELILKTLDIEY